MDFVHCNKCFNRKPPDGFFISSCFHIFCTKCAKADLAVCLICKKNVRLVRLDGNISSGIKIYFADPIKMVADSLAKIQKKIDFQQSTRDHLVKYLTKEKEKKRQMEVYFRTKGQEFDSQRKKLAEATAWIQMAEKKLQASEEERVKAEREIEECQAKLKSMTNLMSADTLGMNSQTPFPFSLAESQETAPSLVESSANSTFNMVSPLVSSPASSPNSINYNSFFENGSRTRPESLNEEAMFNTMSSGQSANANTSESSAFSVAFNNIFTPSRNNMGDSSMINKTTANQTIMDKTSMSLENWRQNRANSFGVHDISKRDSSLPTGGGSAIRVHHFKQNSRITPIAQNRRSAAGFDRQQIQEMRRISSQPGYLAQRKPINGRSFIGPAD
ncbi:Zip homologous protein 3 [Caenorhabditis elegans]|uniref:Isoform a of Zip homologous protein 3 n=1 Tax=Caenorhabditis elegans TaxID=6239 RepID=C6KRL6-2|nr:Zip homologous protein 3 [Caenorhabditis elegans]CAB00037.3 Zip homologous protein 3 [Caenorhabditis elegans]|eukprot:NP_001250801.1 Zip (yeast meiotic zipper) Homologous Protein [Caenorhabditis elegans]